MSPTARAEAIYRLLSAVHRAATTLGSRRARLRGGVPAERPTAYVEWTVH